jgi:hypothetical protein
MSSFYPVLVGGGYLRSATESVVTGDNPGFLDRRLDQLDENVKSHGLVATFGAEIEFCFLDYPKQGETLFHTDNQLYRDVINEIGDDFWRCERPGKGWVVDPSITNQQMLLNQGAYASPDGQEGLIEIRTAPAGALEAVNRYWRVVDAIGRVAKNTGLMGMIHSTHISASAYSRPTTGIRFLSFRDSDHAQILASTQHYLEALHPLQFDSGIEESLVVLEAFPTTKDASTTVHESRLEFRHATTGIADPRIDVLAFLNGAHDYLQSPSKIPAAALRKLRGLRTVFLNVPNFSGIEYPLEHYCRWDIKSGHLVMPAEIDPAAGEWYLDDLNSLVKEMSEGKHTDYKANHMQFLQETVAAISADQFENIKIKPTHPNAQHLEVLFKDGKVQKEGLPLYRVMPEVFYDTPESHLTRRRNLKKSPTVRAAMGSALASLIDAEESVARRNALLENCFVASE